MGAWGVLAFDDDHANDWAYGLDDADDLSLVESALKAVEDADVYLEAPEATAALAACEVLARLKGQPGYKNAYTKKVDDWVAAHPFKPSGVLVEQALATINRILGDNSELRDLWSNSDENERWLASVEDLRQRLQA
jgi:hypothetical protein